VDAQQRMASTIWHLYDWYLRPGGSYYGVKSACEPLHVQYSVRRSICGGRQFVLPGIPQPEGDSQGVRPEHDREVLQGSHARCRGGTAVRGSFTLPEIEGLSGMYFVDLRLKNGTTLRAATSIGCRKQAETVDFEKRTGERRMDTDQDLRRLHGAEQPAGCGSGCNGDEKD